MIGIRHMPFAWPSYGWCFQHKRMERYCPEPTTGTITFGGHDLAALIVAYKKRELYHGLHDIVYNLLLAEFKKGAKQEDDPCPFCGNPVYEDSFASSYGSPTCSTWTIDVRCRSCDLSYNKHTSTHEHAPATDDPPNGPLDEAGPGDQYHEE